MDKRRERKPLTKLGLVKEPNPVGGPGVSTQTMKGRSELWNLQQKTSMFEVIWKFLNNGCAAKRNGLGRMKKIKLFQEQQDL